MGICTKCGYLATDAVNPGDPVVEHVCSENKRNLTRSIVKLLYDIVVYADPASTATKKNNALGRIQTKRAWIEANADELRELLA